MTIEANATILNIMNIKAWHMVGIGGSGMMPLALLLGSTGAKVSGCDRAFDRDPSDERILPLKTAGIELVSESSDPAEGALIVLSTAVEDGHQALTKGNEKRHRAAVLAELVEQRRLDGRLAILVAGSSGKTSTAAMIAWILRKTARDPWVYLGAGIAGDSEYCKFGAADGAGPMVVEVDESDGSIARFTPDLAVITSVSHDHKPIETIKALFADFAGKAGGVLLSEQSAGHIRDSRNEIITCASRPMSPLMGDFNRVNESLAVAAAVRAGVNEIDARDALGSFPGVKRRLEIISSLNGRQVIDDYAHNPEKIEAALAALEEGSSGNFRCLVIFQPHGYGPSRIHKAAWAEVFSRMLKKPSRLILLPIYDAGGTVERDISSRDIQKFMVGIDAEAVDDRADALEKARKFLRDEEGMVVVMGARDPSLSRLAHDVSQPE